METSKRTIKGIKILGATVTVVFTLASVFTATAAWFASNNSVEATGMIIQAKNDYVNIESLTLCKFNYSVDQGTGLINYLSPEDGSVDTYSFVSGEGHNRFEDAEGNPQTMNVFDPVSIEIGENLRNLYCNCIYEVVINSPLTSSELKIFANRLTDKAKSRNDIFLSDCLDFDVFTEDDLDAVTTNVYYPSYIDEEDRGDYTFSGYDEIYYKISYLSSLKASHANFYKTKPKPNQIAIHDPDNIQTIDFVNSTAKFYINVNYAPKQLEKYSKQLINGNINAIFDYVFVIDMSN